MILALLLAGAAAATPVAALPAVFGIQLGAAIDLPQCRTGAGGGVEVEQPVTCSTPAMPEPQFQHPWPTSTIWFPVDASPTIVKNWNLRAMILGGVVQEVAFYTYGAASQELTLRELEKKFGAPSSQTTTSAQTAAGASTQVMHANWIRPSYQVHFDGVTDRLDFGEVTISTANAIAERASVAAADAAKRPAL